MSNKHKKDEHHNDSSAEDYSSEEDELDIQEEIINKIKNLSSLKEKVHSIAINHYLSQKRTLDEHLQREIEHLEQNFRTRFEPFINQINLIIGGQFQFKDEDFEGSQEILTGQELVNKDAYTNNQKIPEYWLKVFFSSDVIAEQVHEIDEPLLKHLQKIQAEKTQDLQRFSVYFYFSQNEWFSNTKLAKHFEIEDTQIKRSYGDQINWKEGKNITLKTVKKKGKKGTKKTKQVKQPSFFNLFKSIQIHSEDEQNDPESQNQQDQVEELQLQYEICQNIYEELIPKSLQYYLGLSGGSEDCCDDQNCTENVCVKQGVKAENQVSEQVEDNE